MADDPSVNTPPPASVTADVASLKAKLEEIDVRVKKLEKAPLPEVQLPNNFSNFSDELGTLLRKWTERLSANERVQKGMCETLGLNYQALIEPPDALSVTGEHKRVQLTKPTTTLSKISFRQTLSTISSVVTVTLIILQLVRSCGH